MIPTKFFPAAVIVPVLLAVFVNLKLPETKDVSLVPSSRTTSAEKVETPTALSTDATFSNPNVSTLTKVLPLFIPLIIIVSFFTNLPFTSVRLIFFELVNEDLT